MARDRSFEVSGLNIRVHSKHTEDEYEALWRMLHTRRRSSVWGYDALMIGEVYPPRGKMEAPYLFGDLYKFLNIDPNDPWFDVARKKPATKEDVSEIVIPDNLKPNFSFCPYIFDLRKHKLYFISKSSEGVGVSPSRVKRLIEYLSGAREIGDRFNDVNVTILTDRKKVSELLSWEVIRTLEIYIERPNANDKADERRALDKLNGMRANSKRTIWKKAKGAKSIVVDEETRLLANAAADNGVVKVSGRNQQGVPDKASSESYPMHKRVAYDPDTGDLAQIFRSYVVNNIIE
ncbi:DUF4747 family protein [Castellaniella ginsengisoli]|uniref:DUF4747 family protein n=1 Tax=Castellaniella ginsengisoli TaxID=546114 RepID=A0AB39EM05_9BURK